MEKKDLALKLGAYLSCAAGSWAYFAYNPYMGTFVWALSVMLALARVTFTFERIEETGSGVKRDIFDAFLTMGALVAFLGGISAVLAGNTSGSLMGMIVAFILLNFQVWFTHKRKEKWW